MMPAAPIAIDLCCGLGGWTAGLLAEGYRVIGFDIARPKTFPDGALFVQQDVATIDGTAWRGRVALVVASPPCQLFSQIWRISRHPRPDPEPGMVLVRECVRIAREAGVPFVLENVQGAIEHIGREFGPPTWFVGPFYFWGARPVLVPQGRFVKGAYNTNDYTTKTGKRIARRRPGTWQRDPARAAMIPLEIARAVARQAKDGALWM